MYIHIFFYILCVYIYLYIVYMYTQYRKNNCKNKQQSSIVILTSKNSPFTTVTSSHMPVWKIQ